MFQESEEEVTDTEQAENWFSLTSAQRICGGYLTLVETSGFIYLQLEGSNNINLRDYSYLNVTKHILSLNKEQDG